MSRRVSPADRLTLQEHGYRVEPWPSRQPGARVQSWSLYDERAGVYLMIGSHGQVAPTEWEAVAEGLQRIEQERQPAEPTVSDLLPVLEDMIVALEGAQEASDSYGGLHLSRARVALKKLKGRL